MMTTRTNKVYRIVVRMMITVIYIYFNNIKSAASPAVIRGNTVTNVFLIEIA